MKHFDFVHLHVHTEFSLLDGACGVEAVVQRARELGMPALAITDHGNLFGAIDFYKTACAAGVKPIIGCEVYVAPGSRYDKDTMDEPKAQNHLILLVRDDAGYQNLIKLVTAAHVDNFFCKNRINEKGLLETSPPDFKYDLQFPFMLRIDKELLAKHAKGLIGLTGCLQGEVPKWIWRGQPQLACEAVDQFRHIFEPGCFYLELQDHGLDCQRQVNRGLCELARKLGLPLVATNNAHYLRREHAHAHDCLICIGDATMLEDEGRFRLPSAEFYLKSAEEMAALFAEVPEAIRNTTRIADQCNWKPEPVKIRYPNVKVPTGFTPENYLRHLSAEGLKQRYGFDLAVDAATPQQRAVLERMEAELGVIEKTGFVNYFLIIGDFVGYARRRKIAAWCRGAASGSLLAYLLGISAVDPLRHGLLFERFINPEHIRPPDIDMDVSDDCQQEVIEYMRQK